MCLPSLSRILQLFVEKAASQCLVLKGMNSSLAMSVQLYLETGMPGICCLDHMNNDLYMAQISKDREDLESMS